MLSDTTDRHILGVLQADGRITNSELAKRVGISPPATLERVRKLERAGVIRKYVAICDPKAVGIETFTFVEVTLAQHGQTAVMAFVEAAMKLSEVLEVHHVTGDADFLLKIAVKNFGAYERFVLQTLTSLPHIQHLKTMVVLSTMKQETGLPIEQEETP